MAKIYRGLAASALALSLWSTAAAAEAGHAAPPHHAAVFVGATSVEGATGFTIGLDYERRFGRWGTALILDLARLHGANHLVVAPALVVHPWAGLKALVAVGLEHSDAHDVLVVRIAAGYDVHLGAWSIGPLAAVDRADGSSAVVWGVSAGLGF
ncbi:MAG: hypothetical protein IPI49_25955 [Myxococcales bacterium]|nr:hypothetical protein [Myxococcales bacterium]